VEESADLARVAAGLRRALLGVVQLLDDLHRQVDVVLLELEQRGRIVHQHVGIQHVDALASGHRGFLVGEGTERTRTAWAPGRPDAGQGRAVAACGAGRWTAWRDGWVTCRFRPSVRPAPPGRGRGP